MILITTYVYYKYTTKIIINFLTRGLNLADLRNDAKRNIGLSAFLVFDGCISTPVFIELIFDKFGIKEKE